MDRTINDNYLWPVFPLRVPLVAPLISHYCLFLLNDPESLQASAHLCRLLQAITLVSANNNDDDLLRQDIPLYKYLYEETFTNNNRLIALYMKRIRASIKITNSFIEDIAVHPK